MGDYINELKKKYADLIKEMKVKRSSGGLGEMTKEVVKIAKSKGIESTKAEARDAIIAFAVTGELRIERRVPKVFEVKLK